MMGIASVARKTIIARRSCFMLESCYVSPDFMDTPDIDWVMLDLNLG